jgi:Fungal specific transcription factor domain.
LNSKASELCQTLGYHRQRTSHRPDSDIYVEQFLFWLVYVIDKSLALRLGRSSTIQDHDITILPSPESLFSNRTFAGIFNLWIAGAKIQGEIYELLYCPKALTQSEEVRRSHAQHLIQRLEELDTMTRDATVRNLAQIATADFTDMKTIRNGGCRMSVQTLEKTAYSSSGFRMKSFDSPFSHSCIEQYQTRPDRVTPSPPSAYVLLGTH